MIPTKGLFSAADILNSGNFDGGEAWVCCKNVLVDQVKEQPPVDTFGGEFKVNKLDEEQALFKSATFANFFSYRVFVNGDAC